MGIPAVAALSKYQDLTLQSKILVVTKNRKMQMREKGSDAER